MKHLSAPSVRPKSPRLANHYRYTLYINQERIGRYLLLSDLLDTIKTVSGRNQIKIQRTNTITGKHTFSLQNQAGWAMSNTEMKQVIDFIRLLSPTGLVLFSELIKAVNNNDDHYANCLYTVMNKSAKDGKLFKEGDA